MYYSVTLLWSAKKEKQRGTDACFNCVLLGPIGWSKIPNSKKQTKTPSVLKIISSENSHTCNTYDFFLLR
jgi:hypothetical protein